MHSAATAIKSDAYLEQEAPRFSYPGLEDQVKVYQSLGLVYHHFSNMARIVNTGMPFLILEIESVQMLRSIQPDPEMIAAISARYGLAGFYIFSLRSFTRNADVTTRMFKASDEVPHEQATHMAAGALACYLYRFFEKKSSYKIEQGKFMRPAAASIIDVDLVIHNNTILGLYAVDMGSETTMFEIPNIQ